MGDPLEKTIASVRERVTPSQAEREQLETIATEVLERTQSVVADLPVDADVIRVGSTSRDTWLRGDRDIDVFVRFPPSLDRGTLREYGLTVGESVLPEGQREYAEHPYVSGPFKGYDIDVVPCYRVDDPAAIQSAVDRTPFHAAYVEDRLTPELATDVRVLKRFAEAIGIYGSDLRTRGFSGYLSELLVLEFGSFREVIETAADWRPPVKIDPEDHASEEFDDPLIVIDPTDPGRNVASVVTSTSVARFQHHARAVIADPTASRFTPVAADPLSEGGLRNYLHERDTTPLAIRFAAPAVVDDQLYPQLRRSRSGIVTMLVDLGFDVLRSTTFTREGTAVIFIELSVAELPRVERHEGPPVHVPVHARSFLDTWSNEALAGPFIQGNRYVVERERAVRSAKTMLATDAILEAGLGKQIRSALSEEYEVLAGDELCELLPTFARELRRYYDPIP